MKIKLVVTALFCIGLIIFLDHIVNFQKVFSLLHSFPLLMLLLLFALSTLILFFKAVRFYILLGETNLLLSFWDMVKISIAGQALSPLPGGELMRGVLLKKEKGVAISKSAGVLVTQPILELIVSATITLLGGLFFEKFLFPAICLLLFLSFIIFAFLYKPFLLSVSRLLPDKKLILTFKTKIKKIRDSVIRTVIEKESLLPKGAFYKCIAVIVLANLTGGLILFAILLTVHTPLPFLTCLFIYSASIVLQSLSILPGGLGVTEGGLAGILTSFEIGFAHALVVVIIFRVVTFVYSILLGAIFLLLFYSKSFLFSHAKKQA